MKFLFVIMERPLVIESTKKWAMQKREIHRMPMKTLSSSDAKL
jgi:hypothetical protein